MKIAIISLGSVVKHQVLGIKGTLTHLCLHSDGSVRYAFQPRGLNPETLLPVTAVWSTRNSFPEAKEDDSPDLPFEVLGTEVEDMASGFKGIAVALVLHVNGCVHVDVQPPGVLSKTGAPIQIANFDIRRLKGKAITALSPKELAKSHVEKPSPIEIRTCFR